ncbi:hypothetical protein J7L18_06085 [Candidatus Bathyarchaeota archaeon]|nr:hypothetical protein [Candidatus Bathyarchaeota archaeon]
MIGGLSCIEGYLSPTPLIPGEKVKVAVGGILELMILTDGGVARPPYRIYPRT